MEPGRARRLWTLFEPYHAVNFFSPEAREFYTAAGLKGGWMGYFAARSAALGPVPAEIVIATFYNFHPDMVRRAIPDAWRYSSPEKVLDARMQAVDAALRRIVGEAVNSERLRDAAEIAGEVVAAAPREGRPLFAGEVVQPIPDEAHLALWQYATALREHRGDGHVALLVAEGIDGCEAHVLMTAAKGVPPELQRSFRGWSEAEWAAAVERLKQRGLYDEDGLTAAGSNLHAHIEARTDALAAQPWQAITGDAVNRFEATMRWIFDMFGDDTVPYPNPMGLPRPT